MKLRNLLFLFVFALLAGLAPAAETPGSLLRKTRKMAWQQEVASAQQLLEENRLKGQAPTPRWLVAVSWVARGASFAEKWDVAEKYATEVFDSSLELLKTREMDAEKHLPIAFGAAIEVLSRVHKARGERDQGILFLTKQRENYQGTSIETRIQKNILLLDLTGKPMPPVDTGQPLGNHTRIPDTLKGKVVVFFFWAHWCGNCKEELPILGALYEKYASRGLEIVGPTRLYGFINGGRQVKPEREMQYLLGAFHDRHPLPEWMGVSVSERNFLEFGVSTTPTLVIVGRDGIVKLYHPGTMSHQELEKAITKLLD